MVAAFLVHWVQKGRYDMSVKARIGEIEFEFETEADLKIFLAAARNGLVPTQPASPGETITERLGRVYERLGLKQRAIIAALNGAPDGLPDDELRAAVGADNNQALGGFMGGIAKSSKPIGLTVEHVVQKQYRGDHYHYRLSPEMREVALERAKSGQ